MPKKRILVEVSDDIKKKFQDSCQPFGGEWMVLARLVNIWLGMSQHKKLEIMFNASMGKFLPESGKKIDLGFMSTAKSVKAVP